MVNFQVPEHFALGYFRFELQVLEPLSLPKYKGATLRGGFGHVFKRLVCSFPTLCGQRCSRGNDCPYGYIFETAPPEGTTHLSKTEQVPRPFVIQPPRDQRDLILPGEYINFGLVLVGYSLNYFPYFLAVFRELGQVGLGKARGRYEVVRVDSIMPLNNTTESVYQAGRSRVDLPQQLITAPQIDARATQLSPTCLDVSFLTPTRLRHAGQTVFDSPPFSVLVKSILGRVSSLSYFHCGEELAVDFRGLIDQAKTVEVSQAKMSRDYHRRVSGRQKQSIQMGGIVGQVTYQGDLEPYRSLLVLGELVHIGKGTVFGNGQYRIVTGDTA